MLVEGLERSVGATARPFGSPDLVVTGPGLAFDVAQRYITTAHVCFSRDGFMFEKYAATGPRKMGGGGGEYEPQVSISLNGSNILKLNDQFCRLLGLYTITRYVFYSSSVASFH